MTSSGASNAVQNRVQTANCASSANGRQADVSTQQRLNFRTRK
jgi:hypothetical protein